MKSNNKFSLISALLVLFCLVVIFASCQDTQTTTPDTTTAPDTTGVFDTTAVLDSTTAPDTTTAPNTTESEYAYLERVGLEGPPEYYFTEEFRKKVGLDANGNMEIELYLKETRVTNGFKHMTKSDYEAFANKYEITDYYISNMWSDYISDYHAYQMTVSLHNVEELIAYAKMPEIDRIGFAPRLVNPETPELEYAYLERVGLKGPPEYYFTEEFKKNIRVDENGDIQITLHLKETRIADGYYYMTKSDYEAFASQYGIVNYDITNTWSDRISDYRAHYMLVSVSTVEELKRYAEIPEVHRIDFLPPLVSSESNTSP